MNARNKPHARLAVEALESRYAPAIYMHYEGIPGDVTKQPMKDHIELLSFSLNVNPTQNKGNNSTPSLSEIVVTKQTDKATPDLFKNSLQGANAQKVKIDFVKSGEPKPQPYLQFELENTLISGINSHGQGHRPTESLGIDFTRVTFQDQNMEPVNLPPGVGPLK
jgi:type VI secretion system secreted protein Hcp